MEQPRSNSEKIRSILAAMERSIDVVRRKRLNQSEGPSEPTSSSEPEIGDDLAERPSPQPEERQSSSSSSANGIGHNEHLNSDVEPRNPQNDDAPPRLKARPKRPSEFFRPRGEASWSSKAG